MSNQDELSLDFIDELLADPKTQTDPKKYARLPEYTSTYIKSSPVGMRCTHRGCGFPTYILVKEEPFCTIHAIELLGNLLDEKINHYPESVPKIEKILEAYMALGSRTKVDFDNLFAHRIVIERENHQEFVVTIDERVYRYSAYTSPEGILTQSLLELLG